MSDFPSLSTHLDTVSLAKNAQLFQTKDEKIAKTAAEFEAMLMTQLFQTMRKTVEPSGLFGTNQNERSTYEYLFDQAIMQHAIANGQTWGLAAKLEESWKLLQVENGSLISEP